MIARLLPHGLQPRDCERLLAIGIALVIALVGILVFI